EAKISNNPKPMAPILCTSWRFFRSGRNVASMTQFTVNPQRFDPYKNFKFRVKWDGRYIAGVSRISALRRATEVIEHREGGDPSTSRKSPGTPLRLNAV